jgi:hypothetical protein
LTDIASREAPLSAPTAFAPADGRGYQRVLLKLSGETMGGGRIGVDPAVVSGIARQLAEVVASAPRPTTWACSARS